MNQVKALLYKEFLLEWRQKYALNGILLYSVATIFICYMVFKVLGGGISPTAWNALFWVITLFSAINTVAKSFLQENPQRDHYYYWVCDPLKLILAKIIYSVFLMVVVTVISLIIYSVLLGNPVQDQLLFVINMIVGAIGFSAALTMISGIASKAGNNSMLMAILSFPIIIPLIIMVTKVSKNALDGLARSESLDEILIIMALNAIIITLALLLFPYLWRN